MPHIGLWLGVVLIGTPAALAQSDVGTAELLRRLCTTREVPSGSGSQVQIQRFYATVGFLPVWSTPAGPSPAARAGVALLHRADAFGLRTTDYDAQGLGQVLDSLTLVAADSTVQLRRARADARLTEALLRFATHLHRGRVQPESLLPTTLDPDSTFDPVSELHRARRSGQLTRALLGLQPHSRSYVRLMWAWQRLLRTDSVAARRLRWPVAANLERLRWEPPADSVYLVINIPAYQLQVIRGAAVVRTHRVVVGAPKTPTPEVYSRIQFFQTSPQWKVPRSIVLREILPAARRNPDFLARHNYELYDRHGKRVNPSRVQWQKITVENFPYSVRQTAYRDNALGNVVFRFPNPHDIFLHDTPSRKLFDQPNRALSHGCIRVDKPLQLAVFLLRRDSPEPQRRIERMWNSVYGGYSEYFPLRHAMPICIRYLTCHADDGPALRTLPDVYGLDAELIRALRANPTELLPATPLLADQVGR